MPRSRARLPRWTRVAALTILALGAISIALLGWFPVGVLRASLEQRLSKTVGARVTIGALTRSPAFSFAPDVTASDVRIAQPGWVRGGGDFVRLHSATLRVPVIAALFGRFRPQKLAVTGAHVALYRDTQGRANWQRDPGDRREPGRASPSLTDLTITDSTLSLRDEKRGLAVMGPASVEPVHGLRWSAHGEFIATPAQLDVTGGRVVGAAAGAPYPFVVRLSSSALRLEVTGVSDGVLNLRHFSATAHATAPTLKNVDRIIEAGLFGTRAVDLTATIRHDGRDWAVQRLAATIGQSRFVAHATIEKRGEKRGEGEGRRTRITASMHASQFDFDDLADDAGRAISAARRAAVGPRVLPSTRINLAKLGRTDGSLAFRIDHVLPAAGTVFRTLQADVTLDHRVLIARNIVATFGGGRMTGGLRVDHRSGRPKFSVDLRASGATLGALLGGSDVAEAPVRGRIRLSGEGESVREALSHADGKAALVAGDGTIKRTVADVLGQDLSGTLLHAVGDARARVPLRCIVADFRARSGVLTPEPLAIDTGQSVGRGTGRIVLDGETIALTLAGASKHHSLLRIADPIRIGGTLTRPSISVADLAPGSKPEIGGVLKVLGRSLGRALGLNAAPPEAIAPPPSGVSCAAAVGQALR